jgi:hypothetical protein
MSGTDLTAPAPAAGIAPAFEPLGAPILTSESLKSANNVQASPPTVRITKRRRLAPWNDPRPLDPATIGRCLIVGKSRGLFLRTCVMRFQGTPAKARRAAKIAPKRRAPRKWEPVVISPVFPRGPLALPGLGFLHQGFSRPRRRRRYSSPQRVIASHQPGCSRPG